MQTTSPAIRTFVSLLRDRYGCVLRAWHAVLDTYCRGRIQQSDFVATCHWLGFVNDAHRLWALLRPDGSPLRLYHLSEEEAVNVELFVLSVGRNLDQAWATLDFRNMGVVSLAQFHRFADTLDFKGDANLLFLGLDSSCVGRLKRQDFMTCLSVHSLAMLNDFNSDTRTKSLRQMLSRLSVVAASQSGRAIWTVVKSGIGAKAQLDSACDKKEASEAAVDQRSKRSPGVDNVPLHCEEEPLLKQRAQIEDVPSWQNPLLKRNANIKAKSFVFDGTTEQRSKRSASVPTVFRRGDSESTPAPLLKHSASANRVCKNEVDGAKLPTSSTGSLNVENISLGACNRNGSVNDSSQGSLLDMTSLVAGREAGAVGDRRRRLSPGDLGLNDVSTKECCHSPPAESPTDTRKLRGTPAPTFNHRADCINAEGRAQVLGGKRASRKTCSLGKALRAMAPVRVGQQRISPLSVHGDTQRQSGSELTLDDSERLSPCSVLPGLRSKCAASLAHERIDLDELVKDAFLSPKSRARGAGSTPVRVIRIEHLDQLGIGCRPLLRGSDNAVAVDNSLEGESWRGDDACGIGSANCTDIEALEGNMAFSASLEVRNVAASPAKLLDVESDLDCLDRLVHIKVVPVEVDDVFIKSKRQRGIDSLGLPPGADNDAPATPTQAVGDARIEVDRTLKSFLASDSLVLFGNEGNTVKEDTQLPDGFVNVAELDSVNRNKIEGSREVDPEPEACDDEKSQLEIDVPSIVGQQTEREEPIALVPEVMPAKTKKTVRVRTSISEVLTFRRGSLEHLHSFTEGWWSQQGDSVDNSSDESDSEKSETEFF